MDTADRDIIDTALAETDDFIARGHAIITRNLESASRLATEYPAVAALLPAIRSAMQELFDHLVSVPTLPHEDAAAAAPATPTPTVAATAIDPLIDTTEHAGT